MPFVSEIEVVFATGSLKCSRVIKKNDRAINVMFLAEIYQKLICENIVSCRLKPCMEQIIRFWIDGSVQPILFVFKSAHRLINCSVIRAPTRFWL